jgi:hypothetical protein
MRLKTNWILDHGRVDDREKEAQKCYDREKEAQKC